MKSIQILIIKFSFIRIIGCRISKKQKIASSFDNYLHCFLKLMTLLFLFINLSSVLQAQNKSFYSDLIASDCEILESKAKGDFRLVAECEGFGDYKLQLINSFLRDSINVVSPLGKKVELNLWNHLTEFSDVGEKVEWRYKNKNKPISLIVPYSVQRDSGKGDYTMKTFLYSFVIKLSDKSICITDIVKPSKNQKLVARRLADKVATKRCMKDPLLDD